MKTWEKIYIIILFMICLVGVIIKENLFSISETGTISLNIVQILPYMIMLAIGSVAAFLGGNLQTSVGGNLNRLKRYCTVHEYGKVIEWKEIHKGKKTYYNPVFEVNHFNKRYEFFIDGKEYDEKIYELGETVELMINPALLNGEEVAWYNKGVKSYKFYIPEETEYIQDKVGKFFIVLLVILAVTFIIVYIYIKANI